MAGGYKLFSTGEVLTAANVNNYLMNQTVMVFASAAARTTALSGVLAEGMVSYRTDSHVFEIYNGTSWVSDPSALPLSTVTTKGDIIAATGSGAVSRLAVGSDGSTLVANSAASTGVSWAGPIYTAGKNFAINGAMDIWQRGTSFTPGAFSPTYTADRWCFFVATGSNTISQETTTLPTGARYALKWVSGAAGGSVSHYQVVETANTIPLAGKTVTLQAYITGTTGKTGRLLADYSTSTDNSVTGTWTAIGASTDQTLTSGTYSLVTYSFTVPSNAKSLRIGIGSSGSFANTEYLTCSLAQLEVGSVATAFSRAGGTLAGELAACQRYYYKTAYTVAGGLPIGIGTRNQSTEMKTVLYAPVYMRIAPTITTSAYTTFTTSFSVIAITGINSATAYTGQMGQISFAVGSGTTGTSAFVEAANTSCQIEWSAEL